MESKTKSIHMVATMTMVGFVAGILIVLTYQWTLPRIQWQKKQYLQKSVFEVLPGTKKIIAYKIVEKRLIPIQSEKEQGWILYGGYDHHQKFVGMAIEAKGQGFQDTICVLYGYSYKRKCIVGLKVLESKETPGLGDKIEKDSHFKANFQELSVALTADKQSLANPIVVVKKGTKTKKWEIDAITGATISSKAIGKILNASASTVLPIIAKEIAKAQ